MEKDIKDFTRKLRLAELFSENPENLWLKKNPASTLLKTETVLWNL